MITVLSSKKFEQSMAMADSYEEWLEAATNFDKSTGAHRWRVMDQSRRYDYVSIRIRLDRLRSMRARHDNRGLLFTLNEGIHGNMAGMGNPRLYTRARSGTKTLIIDYVDEIVDALHYLASQTVTDISFEEKIEFFRRARHCFGCSAMMLSGSGSLAYFHMGVVKTLLGQDLLPAILSGSSGGSIVGAYIATQTITDIDVMFDPERIADAFGGEELGRDIGQNLRADDLYDALEQMIPDLTFDEAHELTGRKLNVSVAPVETLQTSRLLNAITSPNVFIREAVMASC
ncbi:MAG: patatin-like phospholipase family protein, partial [Pseudomonadales bacterium]